MVRSHQVSFSDLRLQILLTLESWAPVHSQKYDEIASLEKEQTEYVLDWGIHKILLCLSSAYAIWTILGLEILTVPYLSGDTEMET